MIPRLPSCMQHWQTTQHVIWVTNGPSSMDSSEQVDCLAWNNSDTRTQLRMLLLLHSRQSTQPNEFKELGKVWIYVLVLQLLHARESTTCRTYIWSQRTMELGPCVTIFTRQAVYLAGQFNGARPSLELGSGVIVIKCQAVYLAGRIHGDRTVCYHYYMLGSLAKRQVLAARKSMEVSSGVHFS